MRTDITEITEQVDTGGGIRLFFRDSRVENERAGVLIVHGVAEHSGRYARLTQELADIGIRTFAYDHRGHGMSSGKRVHISRFGEYLDDLEQMIEKSRNALPAQKPLFILGHSMGGLIALNYAQNGGAKVDGLIVSSPGLAIAVKPPVIKEVAVKTISRLFPGLSFDNELDSRLLSHDPEIVEAYNNDPLVHRKITARWAVEYIHTAEQTCTRPDCIELPVLMQVAGDDRIVSPEASRIFFEGVSSGDKTLHFYDSLYHEIYNEAEDSRAQVINDLKTWINKHV